MRPHRSKFSRRPGGSPQAGIRRRSWSRSEPDAARQGRQPAALDEPDARQHDGRADQRGGGDVLAEHEHRLEHPEDGDHQRECGRPRDAEAAHALVEQDERGDRREDGELADGDPRLRAGVEELRQPALRDGQRQEHQRRAGGAVEAHADRAEPGAGNATDQEVRAEQDRASDEERIAGEPRSAAIEPDGSTTSSTPTAATASPIDGGPVRPVVQDDRGEDGAHDRGEPGDDHRGIGCGGEPQAVEEEDVVAGAGAQCQRGDDRQVADARARRAAIEGRPCQAEREEQDGRDREPRRRHRERRHLGDGDLARDHRPAEEERRRGEHRETRRAPRAVRREVDERGDGHGSKHRPPLPPRHRASGPRAVRRSSRRGGPGPIRS